MKNYIFAENLKHKHSFLLKILFIAPIISLRPYLEIIKEVMM